MSRPSTPAFTPRLLLMAAEDNCLVACTALQAGQLVHIDGQPITLPQDIALGHKLARRALLPGDKVLRYGAPIGSMTEAAAIGAHLHTHNLASDYIPTFTLGQDGHHFLRKEQEQ